MPVLHCNPPTDGHLSTKAIDAFHRDGVLIIEGFKSRSECEQLRERANALVEEYGPRATATIFSTKAPQHLDSRYFIESATGIGVFFEEEAFDAEGRLAYPLPLAVNKLGHAMHDLDPIFSAFSKGQALQAVSNSLGVAQPRVMQSMYIFKQPSIGGEVMCHQDSTYLYTDPMSVIGYWFAIDDAHRGNGCLGGIPGEHRKGLKKLFRRKNAERPLADHRAQQLAAEFVGYRVGDRQRQVVRRLQLEVGVAVPPQDAARVGKSLSARRAGRAGRHARGEGIP